MAVREAEPVGSLSEVRDAGLDREDLLGVYRNLLITRGVEERGQMEFLRDHGCSEYQGFLFSPAVPPDAFARILLRGLDAISREGDQVHEAR